MFAAYCFGDPPSRPTNAKTKTIFKGDIVGQKVTYTCKTGYEFVEQPVATATQAPSTTPAPPTTTTTTTASWKAYQGAEFLMGSDSNTLTWLQVNEDEKRELKLC